MNFQAKSARVLSPLGNPAAAAADMASNTCCIPGSFLAIANPMYHSWRGWPAFWPDFHTSGWLLRSDVFGVVSEPCTILPTGVIKSIIFS